MNLPKQSDLIIRENLAIQRTVMSNQTTLLSFIRTSMYFMVAGLSIQNLLKSKFSWTLSILFFIISLVILVTGIYNFLMHRKKILMSQRLVELREENFRKEQVEN